MRLAPRFTITGLMALVLIASISLAAMRYASASWAGGLYLVTHAIFVLAVVGAVCRGPSERAWWVGFALFGLIYLRRDLWLGLPGVPLPTEALLGSLRPHIVQRDADPIDSLFRNRIEYYWVVMRCLTSLLAAAIGGLIAHFLFAAPADRLATPAGRERASGPARRAWGGVALLGMLGLVAGAGVLVAVTRPDAALWVGAAYLLTWSALGIVALGSACGRGRRRMICLGAASFGLGYMVLNRGPDRFESFSHAHLVADELLNTLRPWLPPIVSGFPAHSTADAIENLRIKQALDRPPGKTFPNPATLAELLDYVRTATQAPDGRRILIYVDPSGLVEAEKTLGSGVSIDLERRPVSANLRLALRQLGMVYYVGDGQLNITAEHNEDIPVMVDYYLLLGHCVLALLLAGLGALCVPLVAAIAAEPVPPAGPQPGAAS